MVEVKHLVKRYGVKNAVDDISFSIDSGEIVGFLGPNGAGKSTTMNILTGYISATQGEATIGGFDILEEPLKAKKCIGYLPEQPPLYLDMTVDGYLQFMYELKKVSLPRKAHLDEVCRLCGIEGVRGRIIKNLSKGYRQRVGLAQALLGNPQVLILDEPTVGLDPNQIIEIRDLIRSLGEKHTIILSSHILSEVQAVCDRIIIINAGKLIADGTPESIAAALEQAPVMDGFTGLQRFFLIYASIWRTTQRDELAEQYLQIDPHSPAEFRTNGIARNVDLFYTAFEVNTGDPMWLAPDQSVRIW